MSDRNSASWTADLVLLRGALAAPPALDPAALCERASKYARLSDFGSDPLPALEVLCAAFESEPGLGPGGRLTLGWHVLSALVTRLRLTDVQKRRPELFGRRLNDPILIVGLPRSGTTFLHRLLCALPDARFLSFWEAREPIPDEREDDRAARFAVVAELIRRGAPELELKHPVDLHGPEECMYLLDPSLLSPSFINADAPSIAYLEHLMRSDLRGAYRTYRLLLEYVQASAPDKRLILKSPAHLGALDALVEAVPEVKLVQTHRDPLRVVPSLCSLLETLYRPALTFVDRKRLGRDNVAMLERVIRRSLQTRETLGPSAVFDLGFDALTQDPLDGVRRLFDHFGLGWSAEAERAVRAEIGRGRPDQVGRHRYELTDYGLDETLIRERFAEYRARLGFDEP